MHGEVHLSVGSLESEFVALHRFDGTQHASLSAEAGALALAAIFGAPLKPVSGSLPAGPSGPWGRGRGPGPSRACSAWLGGKGASWSC